MWILAYHKTSQMKRGYHKKMTKIKKQPKIGLFFRSFSTKRSYGGDEET